MTPEGIDRTIFGFLGRNGAAKTTTIRILATILKPAGRRALIGDSSVRYSHGLRKDR